MSKFLVTGAGGYLAGRIMEFLSGWEECDSVVGLDLKQPPSPAAPMTFHRVDIRDELTTSIIARESPDVVIHLAYAVDFLRDTAAEQSINIGGLKRVLDGVRAAGCRQLIVASSTVVYGAYPGISTFQDEEGLVCIHPQVPYCRDKVIAEKMCRDFSKANPGTAVCIFRPAIVVGPHWGNFWAAAFFLLPVLPRIDGNDPLFQFIHEDDLVQLVRLCVSKEASGTFNAAADGALSLREIASLLGKPTLPIHSWAARASLWMLHKLRSLPVGSPPALVDFFAYPWTASNAKAREQLGFEPTFDSRQAFEEAIRLRRQVLANMAEKARGGYRVFNAILDLELMRLDRAKGCSRSGRSQ
ncbi:MAG: NAD-dependent epimerase/dehydratase family protein [Actinomycetota bacterium]